jgi:septum formation protein
MREFSSDYLEAYLAARGKSVTETVGGYKIEGCGVQLFESITGDYFTILGLPLLPLLEFLRSEGAIAT